MTIRTAEHAASSVEFATRPRPCFRLLHVALLIAFTCYSALSPRGWSADVVTARNGMVVTSSAPASDVGLAVLQQRGNAVDAAVAVALAMTVTYPQAGNIGGGGFMMIHPGEGQPVVCVEYRERAPAAATKTMFTLGESHLGHRMVGVPGTVRGLALAHERFGKLPWKDLVLPAVRLSKEGFAVDERLASSLNAAWSDKRTKPFEEFRRVFGPPETGRWVAGDRLIQPELAETMQLIAEQGPSAFYEGRIAAQIATEMQTGYGLITRQDLSDYRATVRQPIHGVFRGHDIYGPPPPSSGGTCLVEMLNILEPFGLRARGRWSAETMHLIIEAQRRGYLDRARHLGDADLVPIPPRLTTKSYAAELAGKINLQRATRSEDLASDIPLASEGQSTTHFCVIDSNGMAVSNTYTLEQAFGSRVVVRGAGFLLNNEMGDFNWKPGHTDRQGNIGTLANQIAPGKRMLSSQTPTIVTRNGRAVLLTGSPGGRTIINTVLCVVLNTLEFEMELGQAVEAPRLHHQWLPDRVRFEAADQGDLQSVVKQLSAMGHTIQRVASQGDANSIHVDPQSGLYRGVADPRRSGKAAAY